MNQLQRDKLAKALIDEAFTCSERGDDAEAQLLMRQSVKVRFHDEIELIIKGEAEGRKCLDVFAQMQLDKDEDKSIMARGLINILLKDERFLKIYKPIFTVLDEEEN